MTKRSRLWVDLDGTLAEFRHNDQIIIPNWKQSGLFLNRRPTELLKVIKEIAKNSKTEIFVISCAPHLDDDPNWFEIHKQEKLLWCKKHLDGLVKEIYIIPWQPLNHKVKVEWLKETKLWDKDICNILIDDDYNELAPWEKNGGKAYHISSLLTKETKEEFMKEIK